MPGSLPARFPDPSPFVAGYPWRYPDRADHTSSIPDVTHRGARTCRDEEPAVRLSTCNPERVTEIIDNKATEDAAIAWVMQLEIAAGRSPQGARYRGAPADIEPKADLARRPANSGLSLLLQGQAHRGEPRAGGPDPFPALRGLGGGRDVGQSRVQLGQFEAPVGSGVEVPAGGGFVQEPFGFAVVI
jgi:hypothetical protein